MQGYRIAVLNVYPAAQARIIKDYPVRGDRSYRIVVGSRPIGWPQVDPTTAWREAGALLARVPSHDLMRMANPEKTISDEEYTVLAGAWIAAESHCPGVDE